MPDTKHRTHHHIQLAVGDCIECLCVEHKIDQPFIDYNGIAAGLSIDSAQIVDSGILMIDIKQLMVFL